MSNSSESVIRWYADPRNWEARPKPGPYSNSANPAISMDRGTSARRHLNGKGTVGGLVQLLLDLTNQTAAELSHGTQIHPGRIDDVLHDRADLLGSERSLVAKFFGIQPDELGL